MNIIRLGPAGEDAAFEKRVETVKWKDLQPIDVEFTVRDTPQHISCVDISVL